MYAVVEIGGMQWRVAKKDTLKVPKVDTKVGQSIELDRVLLVVDKGKVDIGKPFVSGMRVKATVVSHGKADKVKVFKKKRRKGYQVLRGHRQDYTEIRIDTIGAAKAAPKAAKTETKEAAPKKPSTPKAATEAKSATAKKPASASKPSSAASKSASAKPAPSSQKATEGSTTTKKPATKNTSEKKTTGTKKEG